MLDNIIETFKIIVTRNSICCDYVKFCNLFNEKSCVPPRHFVFIVMMAHFTLLFAASNKITIFIEHKLDLFLQRVVKNNYFGNLILAIALSST